MACRIGITTDLIERRRYWENQYPRSFANWQVLHTCYSKAEAQRHETTLANKYGCESHAGGAGPERAAWHVYYFEHQGV